MYLVWAEMGRYSHLIYLFGGCACLTGLRVGVGGCEQVWLYIARVDKDWLV